MPLQDVDKVLLGIEHGRLQGFPLSLVLEPSANVVRDIRVLGRHSQIEDSRRWPRFPPQSVSDHFPVGLMGNPGGVSRGC